MRTGQLGVLFHWTKTCKTETSQKKRPETNLSQKKSSPSQNFYETSQSQNIHKTEMSLNQTARRNVQVVVDLRQGRVQKPTIQGPGQKTLKVKMSLSEKTIKTETSQNIHKIKTSPSDNTQLMRLRQVQRTTKQSSPVRVNTGVKPGQPALS